MAGNGKMSSLGAWLGCSWRRSASAVRSGLRALAHCQPAAKLSLWRCPPPGSHAGDVRCRCNGRDASVSGARCQQSCLRRCLHIVTRMAVLREAHVTVVQYQSVSRPRQ
eukprot:215605-Lingulodinium_polyedra.AAC.1